MDGLTIVGIILIAYGALMVGVAFFKPRAVWKMSKVQAFVKLLGETGTSIFFVVFALILIGIGTWLLLL